MAEFLEVIEAIRAEDASVQRLFGAADGVGVRSLKRDARYMSRLAEAAVLVADVYEGRRGPHYLREAMTTSDFPLLFGDIMDRQLLANYREAPASWPAYCKRGRVRDFRQVKRFAMSGAEGVLGQVVEQDSYPKSSLGETRYTYQVYKYGRTLPVSWETLINDDLGAFQDIPERFGRAARRTEEKLGTELFVDTSGPHASMFTVGNANIVTGNPVLSVEALQTAMGILLSQTDADGEPIMVEAITLVVPPLLKTTAYNIVNATQIWAKTSGGGSSAQEILVGNWLKNEGIVNPQVNFYIPHVATSAHGNTSWFLFADPNNGRPAIELGFLIGHEEPEVFMKAPNALRVGGGTADALNGDFDTDAIEYKIRHVVGGGRLDPKMAVASNGSGS